MIPCVLMSGRNYMPAGTPKYGIKAAMRVAKLALVVTSIDGLRLMMMESRHGEILRRRLSTKQGSLLNTYTTFKVNKPVIFILSISLLLAAS